MVISKIQTSLLRLIRQPFPLLAIAKAKREKQQAHTSTSGALFIAPDGAGSLGDGAMLQASIAYLQAAGIEKFGVVYPQYGSESPDWSYIPEFSENIGIRFKAEDYRYLGSGTALQNYWDDLQRFKQAAQTYGRVYCIGADVMDGFYSIEICDFLTGLLKIAASAGAESTLVGCSFNETPKPKAIKALRELPSCVRTCSRDPVSQRRMGTALKREVLLVADAAFLLPGKAVTCQSLLEWIEQQRKNNRLLIGINTNSTLINTVQRINVPAFVAAYVSTLTELFQTENDVSFVMVPHDDRFEVNDASLARQVLDELPESIKPYCNYLKFPCVSSDVKAVCGALDWVVTSRMHVAIAALGQGTPTISIGYQGKHEGLYEHFGIPELLISPETAFEPHALAAFIQSHLPNQEPLKRHILEKLPQIHTLAKKNFNLEPSEEVTPIS